MKISSFYLNDTRNKNIFNYGNKYISLYIYFFIGLFIFFAKSNFSIMTSVTNMYMSIIIPSLFPFILFNNILINSNYYSYISNSKLAHILSKIFKTNLYGATSIIIGYTMGFPNGARYLNQMYISKQISKSDSQRLMLFINNNSPVFLISAVGIGMFSNIYIGIIFLISCSLSSILTSIISYIFEYKKNINTNIICNEQLNTSASLNFNTLTKSILDTFVSLAYIYGFMAIFSILPSIIINIFNIENHLLTSILNSISEISMRNKINI